MARTLAAIGLTMASPLPEGRAAAPALRLVLHISGDGPAPAPVRRASAVEAARVWGPLGVELRIAPDVVCDAPAIALNVTFGDGEQDAAGHDGLGAIAFSSDGVPAPAVTLHYQRLVALTLGEPFMGLESPWWPISLRHQLISRAAGRTLAHEIGHFLLRSPQHGRAGLMRARQPVVALSERGLNSFGLSNAERARLDIGLKAWMSQAQPSDACPPG